MAQEQAQAAPTAATAVSSSGTGENQPQPDVESVTLEQLDTLFTTGTAEIPMVSGEEEAGEAGDPPVTEEPGDPPAAEVADEEVVGEEVEETRDPEEIEQAQAEARERVKAEGGDEAAQEAAAEEAGQPVAEPPVKEPSKRFRVKDPMARAALELFKAMEEAGTPISLSEAETRVKGPAKEPAKEPEPPIDYAKTVTDLEAEVATLEQQLEERGADEGLFDANAAKLVRDLNKKSIELERAKANAEAAERTERATAESLRAKSEANRAESHAMATSQFPAVANKASVLGKAVSERIKAMKADPNHPDRPILFADSAPLIITRMVAAELGIAPVITPSPKAKVVAPPKKVVAPAPGGKSSAAQQQTGDAAKKQTVEYLQTEASLEELDKVFGMDQNPLTKSIAA